MHRDGLRYLGAPSVSLYPELPDKLWAFLPELKRCPIVPPICSRASRPWEQCSKWQPCLSSLRFSSSTVSSLFSADRVSACWAPTSLATRRSRAKCSHAVISSRPSCGASPGLKNQRSTIGAPCSPSASSASTTGPRACLRPASPSSSSFSSTCTSAAFGAGASWTPRLSPHPPPALSPSRAEPLPTCSLPRLSASACLAGTPGMRPTANSGSSTSISSLELQPWPKAR